MARILIADDDPGAREMLSRICAFQGHDVEHVGDAARAQAAFERERPDLVLLDLAMPLGGGKTFLKAIREQATEPQVPVIVISGYVDVLEPEERESLGATAILKKPLEFAVVMNAIETALAGSTGASPDSSPDDD